MVLNFILELIDQFGVIVVFFIFEVVVGLFFDIIDEIIVGIEVKVIIGCINCDLRLEVQFIYFINGLVFVEDNSVFMIEFGIIIFMCIFNGMEDFCLVIM